MTPWMVLTVANALAISPDQVESPRASSSWVVDQADVLDDETEAFLNAEISRLEEETTVEVAVVTVDDTELTPKEFTTALFELWGIGKAGADNGLLVVMVIGQRRLEMEPGYGLEPILSDSWLGQMQAESMVPFFKDENYGAGLMNGVQRSAALLREHPLEARLGTRVSEVPKPAWPDPPPSEYGRGIPRDEILLGSTAFGGFSLLAGLFIIVRRRRRTCPDCGVYMPMLDEQADDAHLDAGQCTEERVKSVNWKVHACPTCDHVRSFRATRRFSGHKTCPKCDNRTRTTERKTLSSPTYTHSGSARVTDDCAHCSYHTSRSVILPRKQRPKPSTSSSSSSSSWSSSSSSSSYSSSSRSSSSSSSFGGGRSGGGGAGSSW